MADTADAVSFINGKYKCISRIQSHSSWEAGGLSYQQWQQIPQWVFNKASLPPAPTYQGHICLIWTISSVLALLRLVALTTCISNTSPSLLARHQQDVSWANSRLRLLSNSFDWNNNTEDDIRNTPKEYVECHLCVLVYATHQVSKSGMTVVPKGYCLTKTKIKGFIDCSWECVEAKWGNTVYVPEPGWLPLSKHTGKWASQKGN